MIVETTEHRPSFWKRLGYLLGRLPSGTGSSLDLLLVPFLPCLARGVTGRVSYVVEVPLTPADAHERVKRGLTALWRTRVLAVHPEPILAACHFGDFRHLPLRVRFELTELGLGRTEVEIVCDSGGNRDRRLHERRREELRRFAEFLAAAA